MVTPSATRNRPKRFAGSSAEASIHASGVPEDNPEDLAVDNGRSSLLLKAHPSH